MACRDFRATKKRRRRFTVGFGLLASEADKTPAAQPGFAF
jgi:hypothetical protein